MESLVQIDAGVLTRARCECPVSAGAPGCASVIKINYIKFLFILFLRYASIFKLLVASVLA